MQENELIRLDAQLRDVIDHAVFYAELDNGHGFVAVAKSISGPEQVGLTPPERVTVEFSPYDMSRARIVSRAGGVEVSHEST